ncbi:MAG: Uma2 family endonuclease [Alphaproteobacteria bacterium]|nr:Uma2 family endonuclease [Alphaproteobacteria bacterium]
MDQAVRKRMTLEEFLAWERRQELRYEFDGIRPIAMTGGTLGHSAIATNLVVSLQTLLRGGPCRAFRSDVKIIVADHVRYPDAVVTCTPAPPGTDIVPEPVVVVEVLSPSTASTDRSAKNAEYRATPSIQHYVMLEQSAASATVFSRAGYDWIGRLVMGLDAVLALPALGVEVPLAEIYAGIELAEDEADD